MKLGIPKETVAGESRVATTPEIAKKIVAGGVEVLLERGAGEASHYTDAAYEEVGVTMDRGFIPVDERLRTNVDGVYAVGDIVDNPAPLNSSHDYVMQCSRSIQSGSSRHHFPPI